MAALRFWFSAPFRTRVTFDSSALEWSPADSAGAMAQAAALVAEATGAACTPGIQAPQHDPEHRYATLSEDADQQFVTPLFEIAAPPALCKALAEAMASASGIAEPDLRIDVPATRIVIFDNTVAILEWGCVLECAGDRRAAALAGIDRASFLASSAGVAWIQQQLMPALVRAVEQAFGRFDPVPAWPRWLALPTARMRLRRRLALALRRPREATAFFDMPATTGGNGLMWVSRILACPGPHASDAAWEWAGRPRPAPEAADEDTRLCAGVGNSVLLSSDAGMADVVSAYRKLQYLYALLDIHGRNITRLYSGFLAQGHGVLASALQRLDRIQSHLNVVEARTIDMFAGLQGARARHCRALSDAWDLPGKQQGVHRKATIAKDMVERFAQRQSMKYQKIVQVILAAVGVFALADVVINLTAFSQSMEGRPNWGIIKAVRAVDADTLLTGTGMVLLLSIVILGLLFRRG